MARVEGIKVKPSTMLLTFAAVLSLAYVTLGTSYLKQRQEQQDLQTQVEQGNDMLSNVGGSQESLDDLQEHLGVLQFGLDRLQKSLPASINSAAIVQSLLDNAEKSDVVIKQMSASPITEVQAPKQGDPNYLSIHYTVDIQAELPHILSFLSLVENNTSQTAEIGDVDSTVANGQTQMTLTISYYARPAAAGTPTPAATTPPSEKG